MGWKKVNELRSGCLIEVDMNTMQISRVLKTQNAVYQIQRVKKNRFLLGEGNILELVDFRKMESLDHIDLEANKIIQI